MAMCTARTGIIISKIVSTIKRAEGQSLEF